MRRELHCLAPSGQLFCASQTHLDIDGHGGNWPARYVIAENPAEWTRLAKLPGLSPCSICEQGWQEVGEPDLIKCHSCNGRGELHPGSRSLVCHDCGGPCGSYMVVKDTWTEAWPTYKQERSVLMRKFKGTAENFRVHLLLCIGCLEHRLGRGLTPDDFDLSSPINSPVALGITMGQGTRVAS